MPTVEINQDVIEYTLSRRAKRNINLTIKSNGEIFVSAPKRVPQYEINNFLKDRYEWIKDKTKNLESKKNVFEDKEKIWYKGLQYETRIVNGNKNGVDVFGNSIIISSRDSNKEYVERVFNKWMYNEAQVTYTNEVKKWLSIMDEYNLKMPQMQVRKMRSRWGSCIPSKGKICLNISLMNVPTACMEYVVLHELTHFIEANHSKNFYFIVEKYMPDWKHRRQVLNKEFGNIL